MQHAGLALATRPQPRQEQVEAGRDQPVEGSGVTQHACLVDRPTARWPRGVVYRADTQQPFPLEWSQLVGERGRLGVAEVSVVVDLAMAVRHGRVEPRDHHVEVGDVKQ